MLSFRDSFDRPGGDQLIDLGHQADGFIQGDNDLLVVLGVVVRKRPAFAIFEPFLADLIAADMKFPHLLGHAFEVLILIEPNALVFFGILNFFNDIVAFFGERGDKIMEFGRFEEVERNQLGAFSGESAEKLKFARQRQAWKIDL